MIAIEQTADIPEIQLAGAVARFVSVAATAYAAAGVSAAEHLRSLAFAPVRAAVTQPPAVASIGTAIEAAPAGDLALTLTECASRLVWSTGTLPRPASIEGGYAFVEIVGPDGLAFSDQVRFGLYLQAPERFYPPHDHEAEEFYFVLSGDADWQRNDGAFETRSPGTLVHHAPWDRHAMRTGQAPLLAMWLWTGNLDMGTYRIDADSAA